MQAIRNLDESVSESVPYSFISTVISCEVDGTYVISWNGLGLSSMKAYSCLVTPVSGDVVSVISTSDGQRFITAIIDRKESAFADIALPENTRIFAPDSLQLASGNKINISAPRVGQVSSYQYQKSEKSVWDIENSVFRGATVDARLDKLTLVAKWFTTIADQALHKFCSYIRKTEQSDQVEAGLLTQKSRGVHITQSKVMIMNSEKDTRINGERIHMG